MTIENTDTSASSVETAGSEDVSVAMDAAPAAEETQDVDSTPDLALDLGEETNEEFHVDEDGNEVNIDDEVSFLDALPEDLRGEKSLSSIKNLDDLAKSYVNAQKMIGAKVESLIPGEGATQEQIDRYREIMGVPSDSDGYNLTLNSEHEIPAEFSKEFAEYAHMAGLSQKQASSMFQAIAEKQISAAAADDAAFEKHRKESAQTLRNDWGDAMKGNLEIAQKAINEFGGSFTKSEAYAELSKDPEFIRMMHGIGSRLVEPSVVSSGVGSGGILYFYGSEAGDCSYF